MFEGNENLDFSRTVYVIIENSLQKMMAEGSLHEWFVHHAGITFSTKQDQLVGTNIFCIE